MRCGRDMRWRFMVPSCTNLAGPYAHSSNSANGVGRRPALRAGDVTRDSGWFRPPGSGDIAAWNRHTDEGVLDVLCATAARALSPRRASSTSALTPRVLLRRRHLPWCGGPHRARARVRTRATAGVDGDRRRRPPDRAEQAGTNPADFRVVGQVARLSDHPCRLTRATTRRDAPPWPQQAHNPSGPCMADT